MCDPVTIGLAVAGISAAGSIQQSIATNDAAEATANANNVRATADLQQTELRRQQELEAAGDDLLEARRLSIQEQATLQTAAGEAGNSGLTFQRLQRRARGGLADAESGVRRNSAVTELNLGQQATAITRGTQAANDSLPTVSPLDGIISAIGAGVQGYAAGGGSFTGGSAPTTPSTPSGPKGLGRK